jgi:hypothetical protein
MLKAINFFEKAILSAMILLIILLSSFQEADGEKYNESFQVYDEMRISTSDIDCNYFLEDYQRRSFDFEYPKLIMREDGTPILIFIDEKSQQLIFTEIQDRSSCITNTLPSFGKNLWEYKWPIIFVKNNIMHLAVIENEYAGKRQYRVRIFTMEKKSSSLNLHKEIMITNGETFNELSSRRCLLSGIYPYGANRDNYFIHGRFSKEHFHLLGLISGHFPTFDKNFSIILEGSEIGQFEEIDEKGKFAASRRVYAVSDSGIANAAWIRHWINVSSEHDEVLCFSLKNVGEKWTKPLELYSVKDTKSMYHIRNLSIANYGSSIFLLWQDIEKGFYFSELKDGLKKEITQLGDMKPIPFEVSKQLVELPSGLDAKLTVDQHGNVYALWVLNSDGKYQTFLKARMNGRWTETLVINNGRGTIKLPDMKVDEKKGFIHIAYLKGTIKDMACYYTKLKLKGREQDK